VVSTPVGSSIFLSVMGLTLQLVRILIGAGVSAGLGGSVIAKRDHACVIAGAALAGQKRPNRSAGEKAEHRQQNPTVRQLAHECVSIH